MSDFSLNEFVAGARTQTHLICYIDQNDQTLSSGTGFFCEGYFITNHHVFLGPPQCRVVIFNGSKQLILTNYQDFANRLVSGSDQDNQDFAILRFPELDACNGFHFQFGDPTKINICDPVAVLGYPFGSSVFCVHQGSVSARFRSGPADCIQIDASVNVGNSGGPLIELRSGKVIGIVTRKATGLTRAFAELKKTIVENISYVQKVRKGGAMVSIAGIDPIAALEIGQQQMLTTVSEIERSANVGIGYAFSISDLKKEGCFTR